MVTVAFGDLNRPAGHDDGGAVFMLRPAVPQRMCRRSAGYLSCVTSLLPYLIALGFAPVGAMLLLTIVTRRENSSPKR